MRVWELKNKKRNQPTFHYKWFGRGSSYLLSVKRLTDWAKTPCVLVGGQGRAT
jgi:hypothetical protein